MCISEAKTSPMNNTHTQYEIDIQSNPDRWRGGFQWVISKAGFELDCGLAFSENDALQDAQQSITKLCDARDTD